MGKSVHGQRGMRTPYPPRRALSPFSTGLGDSCSSSPSRGTQSFVLPATAVTKRNGLVPGKREGGPSVWTVDRFVHQPYDSLLPFWWWIHTPTLRVISSLKFREACEPPTRKRVLSSLFHRTGRLLFVISVAGDTNLFVLSVNLSFPFLPVVLQWTGMQVR